MELRSNICKQFMEKGRAFTQITLDDDYIVRDHKPDVIRTIYTKGEIHLEDVKVGNQVLWVTGKLSFACLYQSDDENRKIAVLDGEVPFQEKLVMDEVEEWDDVNVDTQIEDLSVGIINSRKLAIRGVINFSACCGEIVENEICSQVEETGYEQKIKEEEMLCVLEAQKDVIHMQKEILLPSIRTNIGEILFYQVDFRNQESCFKDGSLQIQMDASVFVLYKSEVTGEYECHSTVVPLSGKLEVNGDYKDDIYWTKIRPVETTLEAREDYDGESRMLGLDVSLSVELQVYEEVKKQILLDAYSLENELILQKEAYQYSKLLMKNVSKLRIFEQKRLEPGQENILQISGYNGRVGIDRIEKEKDGLHIEGMIFVHILYNTTDDTMPYAQHYCQIPFQHHVEIPGFSEEANYQMESNIEQLQINLLDNREFELKAGLEIAVFAVRSCKGEKIVGITEEALDIETLQKQPGMIAVIRTDEEDLWDIAKKYHATTDNIIEMDGKVLVMKQLYS